MNGNINCMTKENRICKFQPTQVPLDPTVVGYVQQPRK